MKHVRKQILLMGLVALTAGCKARKGEPTETSTGDTKKITSPTPAKVGEDVEKNQAPVNVTFDGNGVLQERIELSLDQAHSVSAEQLALPRCDDPLAGSQLIGRLTCNDSADQSDVLARQVIQRCAADPAKASIQPTEKITIKNCKSGRIEAQGVGRNYQIKVAQ